MSSKIMAKVYLWMSIGLAITFITGSLVASNPSVLVSIFSNYTPIVLLFAEIALVIFLSARIRKLSPSVAKILFIAYSILTGMTFSIIFVAYNVSSIMNMFLITAAIMLVLAYIGTNTNIDLTKFGTYLFMALIGIVVLTIINIFIGSSTVQLVACIVSLAIFIGYIAYDVQTILRMYEEMTLTEDKIMDEDNLAIFGALQLYLDFINIFLDLLRLFGKNK